MCLVFKQTHVLSKLLQAKNQDVWDTSLLVSSTIESLQRSRADEDGNCWKAIEPSSISSFLRFLIHIVDISGNIGALKKSKYQRDFVSEYDRERPLKEALDSHDENWLFNKTWNSFIPRLQTLREFCAGLMTAFSNTSSV